jgi:hypothetical protein
MANLIVSTWVGLIIGLAVLAAPIRCQAQTSNSPLSVNPAVDPATVGTSTVREGRWEFTLGGQVGAPIGRASRRATGGAWRPARRSRR